MGRFLDEDFKSLKQLVGVLKIARFKDISGPEALSVAMAIDWVSGLNDKMLKINEEQDRVKKAYDAQITELSVKLEAALAKKKK